MEATRFLDPSDPETGYLSNFHAAAFALDGHPWPTVEHYFQAQKFVGTSWADAIRLAETARAAKELGQSTAPQLRPDWEEIKQRVMLKALVAKFVQNPDLARRLIENYRSRLVEASPTDIYWGEGLEGQGSNHLGLLLMAVREELPEADHQNMLAHGDAASLHDRCESAAWELLQNPEFAHHTSVTPRFSINVFTSPFYGQSGHQLAERLQPLLGKPLAWVTPWRRYESIQAGPPDGWRLHWREPTKQGATLVFRDDCTLQLARWRMHSVAMDEADTRSAPPGEARAKDASAKLENTLWHTPWQVEAVWSLPGPDWDEMTRSNYPPVAEALALELERRNRLTRRVEKRYLMIYAKPDEGFAPHATQDDTLHGWPEASPYGTRWKLLACTEARGAMPRLQAEFIRLWKYWGAVLPIDDVANRRAGSFHEAPLGIAGWFLTYSFGRNPRGEYMEIESDHRMCGPDNYRIYADGSREEMPTYMDEALHQQAVEQGMGVTAPAISQPDLASGLRSRIFKRFLGLAVIAIGLVLLFELLGMEHIHYPMAFFALVMIVLGSLVIWRPDEM